VSLDLEVVSWYLLSNPVGLAAVSRFGRGHKYMDSPHSTLQPLWLSGIVGAQSATRRVLGSGYGEVMGYAQKPFASCDSPLSLAAATAVVCDGVGAGCSHAPYHTAAVL
jgi:hypothetical protein